MFSIDGSLIFFDYRDAQNFFLKKRVVMDKLGAYSKHNCLKSGGIDREEREKETVGDLVPDETHYKLSY